MTVGMGAISVVPTLLLCGCGTFMAYTSVPSNGRAEYYPASELDVTMYRYLNDRNPGLGGKLADTPRYLLVTVDLPLSICADILCVPWMAVHNAHNPAPARRIAQPAVSERWLEDFESGPIRLSAIGKEQEHRGEPYTIGMGLRTDVTKSIHCTMEIRNKTAEPQTGVRVKWVYWVMPDPAKPDRQLLLGEHVYDLQPLEKIVTDTEPATLRGDISEGFLMGSSTIPKFLGCYVEASVSGKVVAVASTPQNIGKRIERAVEGTR
ncbi:MAG TPA: hypothetical protein VMP11_11175 [Verrucomicrobiae bacterium]|nr:hypothetical protein [Verrucomicrobiae bacterium]